MGKKRDFLSIFAFLLTVAFSGNSFAADGYTVTYDCGDGAGNAPTAMQVESGADFTPAISTCERVGYTFAGWAVSGTEDGIASPDTTYTWQYDESKTLTALWSANCNAITLNNSANGGTGEISMLYKKTDSNAWYGDYNCKNAITKLNKLPDKDNAAFAGAFMDDVQYISADGGLNADWIINTPQTLVARYTCDRNWRGSGDTISGVCTGTTYTITLDDNGGNGGATSINQVYSTNWSTDKVAVPTKSDAVFNGYYTQKTGGDLVITKDGSLPVNATYFDADATIYAQWTQCDACNAGKGAECSLSVTNNACKYDTGCIVGYKNLANAGTNTPNCQPIVYNISYAANGGTGTSVNTNHYYDEAKALNANAFTNGTKLFLGWALNPEAQVPEFTNQETVLGLSTTDGETVTLYAVWGADCTCLAQTGIQSCQATAPLGVCGVAMAVAKDGYNSPVCTSSADNVSTCTASANRYYVSYVKNNMAANGGMNNQEFTFDKKQKLSANTYTYTGMKFLGWATAANGDVVYQDEAEVENLTTANNGTVELYAVWGSPDAYTITYQDGENAKNPKTYTVTTPTIILNVPERTGYTFVGWYDDMGNKVTQITTGTTGDITLYARWSGKQYTISVNCGEGAVQFPSVISKPVVYGAEFTNFSEYTCSRRGYVFDGWDGEYTDANKTYTYLTDGNTTLTAKWKLMQIQCAAGTYLPAAYTECIECAAGYYCSGDNYYYNADEDRGLNKCPDEYPLSARGSKSENDCYKVTEVSVSVPENCANATGIPCRYNQYKGRNNVECTPTITSVSALAGAYIDGTSCKVCEGNTYQSNDNSLATSCTACPYRHSISETDREAHAAKTNCKLSVILNYNNGTDGSDTKVCESGVECDFGSANYITQDGYTFTGGWGANASCTDDTTTFTDPEYNEYYACKTANEYTASFDANGGTTTVESVIATFDASMPAASVPARDGYTFDGWYYNGTQYYTADGESAQSWDVASDATLTAQWLLNTYKITFDTAGGEDIDTTTCDVETAQKLPIPERDGYTFDGWFLNGVAISNNTIKAGDCVSDMTLVAQWSKCGECDTRDGVASCDVKVDDNVCTATANPKDGYKDCECNTELKCSCIPNQYTVTYSCDEGAGNVPNAITVLFDTDFTVAGDDVCKADGKKFAYWYDGTSGHQASSTFKWTYTEDKTMTAQYTSGEQHGIVYDTNGGTFNTGYAPTLKCDTGESVTLPTKDNITRAGYEFVGWTQDNGTEIIETVKCGENMEFKADWRAMSSLVDGDYNCAAGTHPDKGTCINCITSCATLNGDGHEYQGEYNICTEAEGGDPVDESMTAENQCYYEDKKPCYRVDRTTGGQPMTKYCNKNDKNILYCAYEENSENNAISCKVYYNSTACVLYEEISESQSCTYTYNDETWTGKSDACTGTSYYCPYATQTVAGVTGPDITCTGTYYRDGEHCISCADLKDGYGKAIWTYSDGAWYGPEGIDYTAPDGKSVSNDGCYYKGCGFNCTRLTDSMPELPHGTYGLHSTQDQTIAGGTLRYPYTKEDETGCRLVGTESYCKITASCDPGYTKETDLDAFCTTVYCANNSKYCSGGVVRSTYKRKYETFRDGECQTDEYIPLQEPKDIFRCIANTYTVLFDINCPAGAECSGSMDSQSFTYDEEQSLYSNEFAAKGYTFVGWNTAKDGTGKAYADGESVKNLTTDKDGSVTLYAQWKIDGNPITYHLNNGLGTVVLDSYNINNEADQDLMDPEDKGYSKHGYKFAGWFSDESLAKKVDVIKAGTKDSLTLWAGWTPITYSIEYDLDNGANAQQATYTIESETKVFEEPQKTGYNFTHWDVCDENYENCKQQNYIAKGSTGNIKVKANWTPIKYHIAYNLNGGSNNALNPVLYTIEDEITLKEPTKTGYVFNGWTGDGIEQNAIKVDSMGDKTVDANWTAITFTVNFDATDAGDSVSSVPCTYDEECLAEDAPTFEHYTFSGWNTSSDGNGTNYAAGSSLKNISSTNNDEITLYAVWNQNMQQCEAGYYYDAGIKKTCETGKYCPGEGMINEGATGCAETCPDGGATKDAGTISIYDCRKEIFGGDSGMKFNNGTAKWDCAYNGDSYNVNCKTIALTCDAGYYYDGADNACTGVEDGYYSPAPMSSGDVEDINSKTLFACPNETNHNDNIGSVMPRADVTDCRFACALQTANIANSTSVTPDETKVSFDKADETYKSCSYTIQCDRGYTPQNGTNPQCVANEYAITLDKNGGNGNAQLSVKCTFDGGACKLPETSGLTRAGYVTANKWCTNANGTGICYDANAVTTQNISGDGTDTILYAAWTPSVFKITLSAPDADKNAERAPVYLMYTVGWFEDANGKTPITKTSVLPSREGYEFAGYYINNVTIVDPEGNLNYAQNALSITTSATTAEAQWSKGQTMCSAGYYYSGTGGECVTPCEANHYCPGGSFKTDTGTPSGLEECPFDGVSEGGASATSASACYKQGLEYVSETGKATGKQTCSYSSAANDYNANCREQSVETCAAGYYFASGIDCTEVGQNYFSEKDELVRHECPDGGTTERNTKTAGNPYECFKTVDYTATYGSGTQVCNYTQTKPDGTVQYAANCRDKYITSCQGGYYRENASAEDCVSVGKDAYSPDGEINKTTCPDSGTTSVDNAASIELCFQSEREYTSAHGSGYQFCNYEIKTSDYTNCKTPHFTKCDAGYYWAVSGDKDCAKVGFDFFGPVADSKNNGNPTARSQCPSQGKTSTETSADASACFKENMPCTVTNGSGVKTCGYSTTDKQYVVGCEACMINKCDEKYFISNNQCAICPTDSFCDENTRQGANGIANAEPQLCSALFDGRYPKSDEGSTIASQCFGECDKPANVKTMVGRNYQGTSIGNTCQIKECNSEYYLDASKSQCLTCPEDSVCDSSSSSDIDQDGQPDGKPRTCAELTNGTHIYAHSGATSINQCYAVCEDYEILGGMAIRDSDTVSYNNVCTYKGRSETDNPCAIQKINGKETCVEVSCNPDYELIDARCQKCNRANATAYKPNGNCLVAKCHTGYHPEGDQCIDDVKTCVAPNAIEATQTWDENTGSFGICKITECKSGYHVEANACVPNTEVCEIEHGTGTRDWDERRGAWGECIATSCAPGYTNNSYESDEPNKQCGRCRNAKSILGQEAVSSYASGCTIATCMYQGELYNLENNECVPICPIDTYEDETGTMRWNPKTKKCERECFDGYMAW